ncbi:MULTISPECIES: hypothetical protein [Streptomyces]|uniref:hypothetical protein n=1 Tax=Streptomyces TaxID=1883 RepID=UPI001C4FDEAF|nr:MULTISPECIES: hypothetical protein [Streptomyces]MCX4711041.1 hypothetical protein [Streptomyces griseus]MDX3336357.1 hypothetical protein [Streptomyces sp. ME02-6979.5a]QXQ98872.1 hypothetical protein KV381_22850 [Streptomyces sp. WY228]
MLTESLAALAAAGGTAVVSAAGTELWDSFRTRVAGLLGRGNDTTERITLERLDRTAAEAEPAAADQASAWASRFSDALEEASPEEQEQLAERLRELVDEINSHRAAAGSGGIAIAGDGGVAVNGEVHVEAKGGGFAANVQNFGSPPENPTVPGRPQA